MGSGRRGGRLASAPNFSRRDVSKRSTTTPNNGGVLNHVVNGIPTDQRPKSFVVRLSSTTGVILLEQPDGKEKEQAGVFVASIREFN